MPGKHDKRPSFTRTVTMGGYVLRVACRTKSAASPFYYAIYTRPDKHRPRIALETKDPKVAEQRLDEYLAGRGFKQDIDAAIAAVAQGLEDERDLSLKKLRDYYVEVYLVNENAGKRSIANIMTTMGEFVDYARDAGVSRCGQLSRALMDSYTATLYKKRKLKPKTVYNKLATIRAALNAAVDAELIKETPIRKWPLPKLPDVAIEPLTRDELSLMLQSVAEDSPELYPILAWIALTGNRPSDACDLRFKQVDLRNHVVHRTNVKVKKLAKYDISREAVALVAAERLRRGSPDAGERVFLHPDRRGQKLTRRDEGKELPLVPWTERALWHALQDAMIRVKFRRHVNLKDLRHTFGYTMANDRDIDCRLQKLRVLMGHADIRMTERYVKAAEAKDEVDHFGKSLNLPKAKKTHA